MCASVISLSVKKLLSVLESTYTGTCFLCSGLAISLILKASLINAERDFLYFYATIFSKMHAVEMSILDAVRDIFNTAKRNDGEAWN